LNKLDLKNITEQLLDTFLMAGKVAREISQRGVKIKIKPDNSPVSDGDIAVDKILTSKIKDLTPNIPIISEETVNLDVENKNKNFWLIDPIDGTREYIKNKDEYTLNAALILDLEPVIGIIYAPAKERLFFSYGMNNAFEIKKEKMISLKCNKANNNEVIGLQHSGSTPIEVLDIYKENNVSKMFRMSSSLKFCIIAAGEADIYAAKARAFEWDIAAGHAILKHAGGIVTDLKNEKFLYGKVGYKNISLIAKRSLNLKK